MIVSAAVMEQPSAPLVVAELELDEPRRDEVLVRVLASGICRSDLSYMDGKWPAPLPIVLGHEGAGVIEAVGEDVPESRIGEHVVLTFAPPCGRCRFCLEGRANLCLDAAACMDAGTMRDGTTRLHRGAERVHHLALVSSFADHAVVPASGAIPVTERLEPELACLLGCGVTTGVMSVTRRANVRPGESVAVFGCGGVGLNVIQGAALCGASRIIAVDLVDSKLQLAREFGATDVVNGKQTDAVDAIKSLTGGLGVDYGFEVIGIPSAIRQAFDALKRGGKAVIVGVPRLGEDMSLPGWAFPLEEKSIVGSLYGSANMHRDMPLLIELYMQKRLKIDELISRRIKLADVNAAFDAMERGEVARSVIVY
jgi:S-(hydroxymethyl)glutathione dehydrogenase / alcohol dehydrogenase